jgi:DNA-directed RNA polymerase subunit RPC12/RpoP
MGEYTYTCNQCRNVFRLSVSEGPLPPREVKCPGCGSSRVEEVPSWAPIGFNLSEEPPEWECACQQCQNIFKIPVPGSPSEAREIRCPVCGGGHIHRLTPAGVEPLYCG